jgi:NADH:ubiquinone oxidoreductase subunit 5 (subunit L)/multisubunit Na+/H+ antiporter MnhA subunit
MLLSVSKACIYPLYKWLLNTLEIPFPLSGSLHGAIVVNSGLIMFSFLLTKVSNITPFKILPMILICFFGSIKSAYDAYKSDDYKTILTYSTISYINSFIIFILHNNINSEIFNLNLKAHSFIKLNLFIFGGTVVHLFNTKNLTQWKELPYSFKNILLIAILSLNCFCIIGFPLVSTVKLGKNFLQFKAFEYLITEQYSLTYITNLLIILWTILINIFNSMYGYKLIKYILNIKFTRMKVDKSLAVIQIEGDSKLNYSNYILTYTIINILVINQFI